MSDIKFGTDGWRAVTDKDFNIKNVTRVTKAVAKYIFETFGQQKTVIVGYDPRRKAREFAALSAQILKSFGFNVLLSDKVVATPVLAYNAGLLNACAIMFTASHNPPEYLGLKFIPDYAGPAEDAITAQIVENIDKPFSTPVEGSIKLYSFNEEYGKHIEKLIDFDLIEKSGFCVNYDALHGAAGKLFTEILQNHKICCNSSNLNYDPDFGGKLPEPAERFLEELKETCRKNGNIGFSNDGDGDRFALVDENGCFVNANKVIALLFKHLVVNKKFTGKLAKTVAGSMMLDNLAAKYGTEVIETAVGFKNLGKACRKNDVIIAGEESGGLTFKNHIPEKDGIAANLLILEAKAAFGKPVCELVKEFDEGFINIRHDVKLPDENFAANALTAIKSVDKIGNFKIVSKNFIDGAKLRLDDEKTSILIRKSGTEPLFRIYFESNSKEKIDELFEAVKKNIGI